MTPARRATSETAHARSKPPNGSPAGAERTRPCWVEAARCPGAIERPPQLPTPPAPHGPDPLGPWLVQPLRENVRARFGLKTPLAPNDPTTARHPARVSSRARPGPIRGPSTRAAGHGPAPQRWQLRLGEAP